MNLFKLLLSRLIKSFLSKLAIIVLSNNSSVFIKQLISNVYITLDSICNVLKFSIIFFLILITILFGLNCLLTKNNCNTLSIFVFILNK